MKPATGATPPADPADDKKTKKNGNGGDGGDDGLHLDGLLMELLRKIPEPANGWPKEQRLRWFRTFAMNVSQIYDGDDVVDLTISLAKSEQQ